MTASDLRPATAGRIERLAAVDSTNAEAMRRAGRGERGPLWIVADVQTAGRGRSGRSWTSEAGNLHASLLFACDGPAAAIPQLSLVAGVAAIDAVRATTNPAPSGLRLKWPNDILIGPAKAGGILVESTAFGAATVAVVGIGIDLAAHPRGLDRPVSHLAAHGPAPSPDRLLFALAHVMEGWLAIWRGGDGFPAIREAWLSRSGPLGERLAVNTGAETVDGEFDGLGPDGALLLRDPAGGQRRFSFGDVSLS